MTTETIETPEVVAAEETPEIAEVPAETPEVVAAEEVTEVPAETPAAE